MSTSLGGASPAPHVRGLDPRRSAKYTVQLGDDILKARKSGKFKSVKFNHKPDQSSLSRTTKISESAGQLSGVTIRDVDNGRTQTYTYSGRKNSLPRSYVLIFNEQKQTCTLEALSSTHNCNLTSTPSEASSDKLAKQFTQIKPLEERRQSAESGDSEEKDLFDENGPGNDTDESEADDSNPFDFRHFLHQGKGRLNSPSASPPPATAYTGSAVNTPQADSGRDTPRKTPLKAATSARLPLKRPPKARSPPVRKKRSPSPDSAAVPAVRLDRRASAAAVTTGTTASKKEAPKRQKKPPSPKKTTNYSFSSDDDSDVEHDNADEEPSQGLEIEDEEDGGGLTIDYGDSEKTHSKKNTGFGLGIADASGGPISLRSAANSASPSSRIQSPRYRARDEDGETFQLGEGGMEGISEGEEEAASPDGDVDSIALPSPVHERRVNGVNKMTMDFEGDDDDDEDDEFEAELMQGLEGEDDEEANEQVTATVVHNHVESESESEEE